MKKDCTPISISCPADYLTPLDLMKQYWVS